MKFDIAHIFPVLLLLAPLFYAFDQRPTTKTPSRSAAVCEETQGPNVCGATQVFVFDR